MMKTSLYLLKMEDEGNTRFDHINKFNEFVFVLIYEYIGKYKR